MIRAWIILIIGIALIVWLAVYLFKKRKTLPNSNARWAAKSSPAEVWVQLYETDSAEEARSIRACITEEDLDCLVFEQGKKDINGNVPKAFGLVVPRGHLSRAQTILAKTLK